MCWKCRIGEVFVFLKAFGIFGYQKVVCLLKIQPFITNVAIPRYQMCWKCKIGEVFVFPKAFGVFGNQKVFCLLKIHPFSTNVAIPTY